MILFITGLILCASVALFYASYSIASGIYLKTLCKKDTEHKIIALTFDDGPHAIYTPRILEMLKRYDAVATFFCTGKQAEENPELIRQIIAEGHAIGNHSYSHIGAFPLFSKSKMLADVKAAGQLLEKLSGEKIILFRPPFGVTNPTVAWVVKQMNYQTIGWNIRSFDTCTGNRRKVYNRIIRRICPGSVLLLHDRLPQSDLLLEMILIYLTHNQYKTVRADKLFNIK